MTPTDEQQFEAYLRGGSDLSRCYCEAVDDMPPAALDAALLGRARDALRPRRIRWTRPLAAAATVVLGATMLLTVQEQTPTMLAEQGATASLEDASQTQPAPQKRGAQPRERARSRPRQQAQIHRYQLLAPGAPSAAPAAADAADADKQTHEMRAPQPPPDAWLARIRHLLEQGQRAAAIAELQDYRRYHPRQPLPPDLRALLQPARDRE